MVDVVVECEEAMVLGDVNRVKTVSVYLELGCLWT